MSLFLLLTPVPERPFANPVGLWSAAPFGRRPGSRSPRAEAPRAESWCTHYKLAQIHMLLLTVHSPRTIWFARGAGAPRSLLLTASRGPSLRARCKGGSARTARLTIYIVSRTFSFHLFLFVIRVGFWKKVEEQEALTKNKDCIHTQNFAITWCGTRPLRIKKFFTLWIWKFTINFTFFFFRCIHILTKIALTRWEISKTFYKI